MGLFSFLGRAEDVDCGVDAIFPLSLSKDDFIKNDVLSTYLMILTDTFERTHGLSLKDQDLLWDNCVQSEASYGLVSLLADAMSLQTDLFLVVSKGVLRKATKDEQDQIRANYKKDGQTKLGDGSVGVYISFKNYWRTSLLVIYSAFEYCVLSALNKILSLAKAIQIKAKDLRSTVNIQDSGIAKGQAKSIASALALGKDVLLDAGDTILTATVDTAPTEKSISFLTAKKSFIISLPRAYTSGEQTSGLGSSGQADAKAIDRGLKIYFSSIVRPVCKALFGTEVTFRSQDTSGLTTALEAAKVFDLVSDEMISLESKRAMVAQLFELNPVEELKRLDDQAKSRAAAAAEEPEPPPPEPEEEEDEDE